MKTCGCLFLYVSAFIEVICLLLRYFEIITFDWWKVIIVPFAIIFVISAIVTLVYLFFLGIAAIIGFFSDFQ